MTGLQGLCRHLAPPQAPYTGSEKTPCMGPGPPVAPSPLLSVCLSYLPAPCSPDLLALPPLQQLDSHSAIQPLGLGIKGHCISNMKF